MVSVTFPGLGLEFSLNPVAFTIPIFGGLSIRWYALIIVTGMITAFAYASFRSKDNGLTPGNMLDVGLWTIIVGIVGARLYYVFANISSYHSFRDVIAVWEGGLAIYGGIIAGGITLFVMCRIYKLDWRCVFDTAAPGVMIAQAIGRWGNFVNGEAFGVGPAESSPLYFLRMTVNGNGPYAPTFLYESVWNLTGFILINIFYKKRKFKAEVFLWYATWYGFGRFFIESLRTDSLYAGTLRISQVVGAVSFVVGLTLIIVFRILAAKKSKYEAVPEGADNVSASVPTPEETVTDTDSPVNESEKAGSAGEETGEGKSDGDTD